MAFAGLAVSVTVLELRQTIRAMSDDAGFIVHCERCKASRYCPAEKPSDGRKFDELHKYCHLRGRRR